MYNTNIDSNNQIPLEIYFSELEQFSVLKKLFLYSNTKLQRNELKKFSLVEKLLFLSKNRLRKNELIVLKHFIENRNTTLYDIRKKPNLNREKIEKSLQV